MKKQSLAALLLAAMLLSLLTGCGAAENPAVQTPSTSGAVEAAPGQDAPDEEGIVAFRPVDCGLQAQEIYDYPFLGLTASFSRTLLDKLDSREVFAYTQEDYLDADTLHYALICFAETTQEQRGQSGMSVDLFAWQESLKKLGALGVYHTDALAQLDALTGCDTHQKLGQSADGSFVYYLSTNSQADEALRKELLDADITLAEMLPLDLEGGYSAFSAARMEGVEQVGSFSTEDIFGTAYDQTVFAGYDLTLVNVFATWCSPCVEEMPELEKLRQAFEAQGIRLGVVAIVLDVRTQSGTDENALERAKLLYERSGAQFPFLLPDESEMNGRLTGIESIPESFFVDGNGNIVSEPYVGARSLAQWTQVVEGELEALR